MILLAALALGLLSLDVVALRTSGRSEAMASARANARLSLMLALGQLQKAAGPDERPTFMSDAITSGANAPHWACAKVPADAAHSSFATVPLVSGENPDLANIPTDAVPLASATLRREAVRVPKVNLGTGGNACGLAWWTDDEGVKAKVDLQKTKLPVVGDADRIARSLSPQEPDLTTAGIQVPADLDKQLLVSVPTLSLFGATPDQAKAWTDDFTSGGFGLPVNVKKGGMKTDLSLVLDRSQDAKGLFAELAGAAPLATTVGTNVRYDFNVTDPSKFYLSKTITGTKNAGPNWGTLWNYGRMWQNAASGSMDILPAFPMVDSDMRLNNWPPYQRSDTGAYQRDFQHQNNPVLPVVAVVQMGFLMKAVPTNSTPQSYRIRIECKPLVGLWNPYNIALKAAPYRFDWGPYAYLNFSYGTGGGGGFVEQKNIKLWMRDYWENSQSLSGNPLSSTWCGMQTQPIDLQPGELRLFSVTSAQAMGDTNTLGSSWNEQGVFYFEAKDGGSTLTVPAGSTLRLGDFFFDDTQYPGTAARFPAIQADATGGWLSVKSGNSNLCRWSGLWNASTTAAPVPEQVVAAFSSGSGKIVGTVEQLAQAHAHLATWSFGLSTSTGQAAQQGSRGLIDSNPRALVFNPRWDRDPSDEQNPKSGWYLGPGFSGAKHEAGNRGELGDGFGGSRGLLAEGALGDPTPQTPGLPRYQGYSGAANTASEGVSRMIAYEIPRTPLTSIGQFQHAMLQRYSYEPGLVVGNSYANARIPLGSTVAGKIADISKEVNEALWDGLFFSTLAPDYVNVKSASWDGTFGFQALARGEKVLPNPRMRFRPLPGDTSIDRILAEAGMKAPRALASRISVDGAFNVNSASKDAWKVLFSSMAHSDQAVIDPTTGALTWKTDAGARFGRTGHAANPTGYSGGSDPADPAFWCGWRALTDDDMDRLATEMVTEVKQRGGFTNLADFVNRTLASQRKESQRSGALQAALDRAINGRLPSSIAAPASMPATFDATVGGGNQATGHAGWIMQGDVLQSLAPVLQVRSDYFRIRGYGESLDGNGKIAARAWCEAFVQREPEYLDPADGPELLPDQLTRPVNKTFGRRFEIASFRWLKSEEV